MRHLRKIIRLSVIIILTVMFLQSFWAHRRGMYDPTVTAPEISCRSLLPFRITCEERLAVPAEAITPQTGDILLTFSTHTLGWRHGHAALVMDDGILLEAAMPGVPSGFSPVSSWETYPTLLLLRVKNSTEAQRESAVQSAVSALLGVPYGFFAGLGSEKAPEPPLTAVQCAYLPWYAWFSQGIDLDSDGGRLVTVADLAASEQLEIIQMRGINPAQFSLAADNKTAAE